jgi:glycosyltransferase involved in cell wall biosynthesis
VLHDSRVNTPRPFLPLWVRRQLSLKASFISHLSSVICHLSCVRSTLPNYLFINYEYPPIGGGSATACQQIARILAKRDHRVVVLTTGIGALLGTAEEDGVTVVRVRALRKSAHQSGILEMLSYIFAASWQVGGLVKAYKIDSTLAFFSIPGGIVARWIHLRIGTPYVISLRGGDVPGTEPHLDIFYRTLEPVRHDIFRHASGITAPSEGLKTLSEKTDPFPVQVIPNGVDSDLFRPNPARRPEVPCLLSVGRLHAQKNVAYLLKLVSLIRTKAVVTTRIIGDGQLRARLEELARALGINDCVQFEGWLTREAVREAYQSATLLIHASTYEGMSNVILEALASGLPVAASRIPENVELIQPGLNGLLLDPEADPSQALEPICSILTNPAEWTKLSRGARETIEKRFPWAHVADQYERLLQVTN